MSFLLAWQNLIEILGVKRRGRINAGINPDLNGLRQRQIGQGIPIVGVG